MKRNLIYCFILLLAENTYATPHDVFLSAKNFLNKSEYPLNVTASIDAVNDDIDLFDLRESEGITDSAAGDYQGINLNIKYKLDPQWQFQGEYWHREIDYSQDTNKIESGLFSIGYTPVAFSQKKSAVQFRASLWGNTANHLSKSTPTLVNGQIIEKVNVNDPQDLQIQFDTIFSKKIDVMNQINFFGNIGYSEVKIDSLDIVRNFSNCPVNIHIEKNNSFEGHSAGFCDSQIHISGDANTFGLDIQKDLNYSSYYAGIGGSWNLRIQKFESQLGYQYQRLWRQDIDDRVANFGNNPIKDNHTLGLKINYDVHPNATVFLKGELYQNNFVGTIPFLYNGVTASRLDKRYGLASVGLTFHTF